MTYTRRKSQVVCNAATNNVSGDLPDITSSKMSQYETIIETLTTLFPVWVLIILYSGVHY